MLKEGSCSYWECFTIAIIFAQFVQNIVALIKVFLQFTKMFSISWNIARLLFRVCGFASLLCEAQQSKPIAKNEYVRKCTPLAQSHVRYSVWLLFEYKLYHKKPPNGVEFQLIRNSFCKLYYLLFRQNIKNLRGRDKPKRVNKISLFNILLRLPVKHKKLNQFIFIPTKLTLQYATQISLVTDSSF